RNSHDSAPLGQLSNHFIRRSARGIRIQCAAVPVRQNNWRFGHLAGVQLGAIARVSQVHAHSDLVHTLNHLLAILAYSAIVWLERAIRDQGAEVVAELGNPLALAVAGIDGIHSSELRAGLRSKNKAVPTLGLHLFKVISGIDPRQPLT